MRQIGARRRRAPSLQPSALRHGLAVEAAAPAAVCACKLGWGNEVTGSVARMASTSSHWASARRRKHLCSSPRKARRSSRSSAGACLNNCQAPYLATSESNPPGKPGRRAGRTGPGGLPEGDDLREFAVDLLTRPELKSGSVRVGLTPGGGGEERNRFSLDPVLANLDPAAVADDRLLRDYVSGRGDDRVGVGRGAPALRRT